MKDELVDSTYLRLKACATSVEQYFTWDIREDILEKDDISYQFIDSLQDEHIEQTLFMEDERFITSIVDKDGNRAEGTKADPQIWETVRAGNDYKTDGVEIQEKNIMSIICRYVPMMERFWEWLLPENGRA